jgi:hypothetical protein
VVHHCCSRNEEKKVRCTPPEYPRSLFPREQSSGDKEIQIDNNDQKAETPKELRTIFAIQDLHGIPAEEREKHKSERERNSERETETERERDRETHPPSSWKFMPKIVAKKVNGRKTVAMRARLT